MTKKEKFMDWVEDHGTHIIVGATLVGLTITTVVGVRNNCKYWKTAGEAVQKIAADYDNANRNFNVGTFTLENMGEFGKKYSEITGCDVRTAIKHVDLFLDGTTT